MATRIDDELADGGGSVVAADKRAYELGVNVGGTFTDFILIDKMTGSVHAKK
jgi:hypothetical protein